MPLTSNTHTKPLNILHTSDWHLGRRLYGRMRYEEFEAFLSWLQETISAQQVDILIVAGDIFDTMTPSNRAQNLYYDFLGKVSKTCCQHIVVVAGNHDSPTFLDAPNQVLKFLNVHVIGMACEDLNDEVLVLNDRHDIPYCIVTAVPYLRDRDVRNSSAGESMDSKDANVINGIRAHYDGVAAIAKAKQVELTETVDHYIPIIATGHLFAAGSNISDNNQGVRTSDDGVRDLYVGNLGKISADMFDECFDYVALGHLHVPQRVGGREHIRYCGSPIPMGFGEARQQKLVLLVQFGAVAHNVYSDYNNNSDHLISDSDIDVPKCQPEIISSYHANSNNDYMDDLFGFEDTSNDKVISSDNNAHLDSNRQPLPSFMSNTNPSTASTLLHHDNDHNMQVVSLPIPCFQSLAQVLGDMQTIEMTIRTLTQSRSSSEPIWLEITYTGDDIVANLREQIEAIVDGLPCEVLISKNPTKYNKVLNQEHSSETLQDLNELEVFERCLTLNEVTEAQKISLRDAYEQILYAIHHTDSRAE
ncbi:exonuclease subunit SbcD [Psychrobacter frigidicola]|uniref:Nuclease SbcCD subunit D n=1 Tax=Psychrobacter frigidicola TaxID=45611 RepID=A0A5C7A5W9_9GAMM|nr:exonuclease subunit SbcD [Psychrobacter frigidicola]